MMQSVLVSIKPNYCDLIMKGKKTVDVRKTRPKLELPFKCYIYCTHSKNGIAFCKGNEILNGKVIGEFICNRIEEVRQCNSGWVHENACMPQGTFFDYLGVPRGTHFGYDKKAYGWCISDLIIYDIPKSLNDFTTKCTKHKKPYGCDGCEYYYFECNESVGRHEECCCDTHKPLKTPPLGWCYVETDKKEEESK